MSRSSTPKHNSSKRNHRPDELKSSTLALQTFSTVFTVSKHCYKNLLLLFSVLRYVASKLQRILVYSFLPFEWLWWIWLERRRRMHEFELTDISSNGMSGWQGKIVGYFQHQININGVIVETRPGQRRKYAVSTWTNKFLDAPENIPHYFHPAFISQLMSRQMNNASRKSVPGSSTVTREINFHDPPELIEQTDKASPMPQLWRPFEPKRSRPLPAVAREDENTDDMLWRAGYKDAEEEIHNETLV